MARSILITGTGTDVGKTALALSVLCWAGRKGLKAAYHKPVQCGDFPFGNPPTPHSDADWIRALLPFPVEAHVTYRFPSPVSPHLASEREGVLIRSDRIFQELEVLGEERDLVVIEGAGGAAVPLDRHGLSMAMLAAEIGIPTLLACAPGLGTLHHTLATLAYLGAIDAPVAGFAFCHREPEVPEIFPDNLRTLSETTGLPCFGTVPYCRTLAQAGPLTGPEAAALADPLSPSLDAWWNATTD